MPDESIRIPIEIDDSKGLSQLARFSQRAKREIGTIGPSGSPGGGGRRGEIRIPITVDPTSAIANLGRFDSAVNKSQQQLVRFTPGANQATFALTNLGRVAQDAPYGFIGIANNLNPLLESFQRLRAETGSSKLALKSLGSSLVGAGGLGLALSAVTAIMQFATLGMSGWSRRVHGASKEAEDSIKSLAQNIAQEASKLTVLVGIVKNVNSSYEQKKNAIAAINQEYGKYLTNLDTEKVSLGNISKSYENIIDAMLRQAVVKGLQEEISKAVEETAKKLIQVEKAEQARKLKQESTIATANTQLTVEQKMQLALKKTQNIIKDGILAQQDQRVEIQSSIGVGNTYGAILSRIKGELMAQLSPLLNLTNNYKDLGIELHTTGDKHDDLVERAKRLRAEFKDMLGPMAEFSELDTKEQTRAKAEKIIRDIHQYFNDFNNKNRVLNLIIPVSLDFVVPDEDIHTPFTDEELQKILPTLRNDPIELPVRFTLTFLDNVTLLEDAQKKLDALKLGSKFKLPSIDMEGSAKKNKKVLDNYLDFADGIRKAIDGINQSIQSLAVDELAQIGEALGTALAGGDLKNVFSGFVNILASGFTAIGKQMIAAAPIIAALKKALKTLNPAILLPAGIALVAIGAALRSTTSKGISGFAQGGLVFGPQLGLVGEGRGTNRSNPEVIAPLDKLKNFFGSLLSDFSNRASNVGGRFSGAQPAFNIPDEIILRGDGDTLVGVMALAQQKQGRNR